MTIPAPTRDEPAPREDGRARMAARLWRFLLIASAIIVVDQATKSIVRANLVPGETWPEGWDLIRIAHVQNTGAAFGILQDAGTFLVVVPLIAIGALTFYLLSLPAHSRFYPAALSMILGGAIGNLIDRVRLGAVTDFIDPTHYPAFNVADSCIVLGVIAIAVLAFTEPDEAPSTAPAEADTERAG